MIRAADPFGGNDPEMQQQVVAMIEHGPYMDVGHPFRMALADWLREQHQMAKRAGNA